MKLLRQHIKENVWQVGPASIQEGREESRLIEDWIKVVSSKRRYSPRIQDIFIALFDLLRRPGSSTPLLRPSTWIRELAPPLT